MPFQTQTVVVENPMSLDESGKLVSIDYVVTNRLFFVVVLTYIDLSKIFDQ